MSYILTLLALVAGFLWMTPAHTKTLETVRARATARLESALNSARDKAAQLMRDELHRTVDGLVR